MRLDGLARSIAPLALLLAGTTTGAAAQQPARPDCSAPDYRQFDFWVGDWDVTNPAGKQVGSSHISRILKDCVIHEEWTDAGGNKGESFNIWSRTDRKWHQSWVSDAGAYLLLTGELEDGAMVLEGETKQGSATVLNRITWSIIDNDRNRVRQHWTQSKDGGATWTTAFDGTYNRRK